MAVLIILLAFVLSAGLTRALLYPGSYLRILDYPLHVVPVPRTGGLAIVTPMFVASLVVLLVVQPLASGASSASI